MIYRCTIAALLLAYITVTLHTIAANEYMVKPFSRSSMSPHSIKGEYIPLEFYNSMRSADTSKQALQNKLRNFLENLQRNLTTSTVLSILDDKYKNTPNRIKKFHELSDFFHTAAEAAKIFAHDAEQHFEAAKSSSYTLLLQLRLIPSTQPKMVKLSLTNYFSEMEFFHILFSEIIDEVLEYTQSTLFAIRNVFNYYADVQQFVLQNWNFKGDESCSKEYMEFLQQYSAEIFKCAVSQKLTTAYDVYSMTELTSKYVMRQLEFRIQRIFNCIYFGNFEIRCKFLQNAEEDFKALSDKLEDLETFYDIKTKNGRVSALRLRRQSNNSEKTDDTKTHVDCIPQDFPHRQMHESLRQCFYNIKG
ncbi:hypothetical protein KR222_010691 [Zaprionus bogoriensis]|nr:hypothetical protein KR222_010691 [Zaprionus bogoriensis]